MTESEAENLVKKIPTIDAIWINNERERERSYKEAVQSNDPERLVGIIKLLYGRKRERAEQGRIFLECERRCTLIGTML